MIQKLRCGAIIDSMKCKEEPQQSYAFYIPLQYSPEKRWPIVYIFDPGARGHIPIELMQEAAEHYGFIIVSSNNSRNGPWEPQLKAARAIWKDTHTRMSIEDNCIFFAGCSGGARVAALLAQRCQCVQGVILDAAGFGTDFPPTSKERFAVFSIVGLTDFNYNEMVNLDKTLESIGRLHFLRRFDGPHQWGPKDIWLEAFAWMQLVAIKNGRLPRDEQFIAVEFAKTMQRAQTLEDSGSTYFAWQNYSEASSLFQGLTDTKQIDEHGAMLKKSAAVNDGQECEERELDEQNRLQNKIFNLIESLRKPRPKWFTNEQLNDYEGKLQIQVRDAIHQLRKNLEDEDQPERHRVFERVRGNIFANLIELGQSALEANDLRIAKNFFAFSAELQPHAVWSHICLARCLIRMGDKDESIRELGQARDVGLSAHALATMLKQMFELSSLTDDPEFQKLIRSDVPSEH
ncbi:MAG: hypothetical protein ABR936_03165 [Bacteroidota bacterium]